MSITIKLVDGTQKSVEVPDLGITVSALKELMAATLDIPAPEQRLVFRGKVLKDNEVLNAVGLEHGNAVHVVRSKKPAAAPQPPSTVTPTAQPTTAATPQPTAPATNPYAALMSGMFGAPGGMTAPTMANPAAGSGALSDMTGGMDPSLILQMMQNPAMAQLVATAASDESLLERNYAFANTPPEVRQYVSTIMRNPAMLQAMASMLAQNNPAAAATAPAGGTNATGTNNIPAFPGVPPAGAMPPGAAFNPALFGMMPPAPQGNPREIYREQLAQLREMGFPNEEANIAALQEAHGNIHFAIERLFSA